jgi:CspA family cold shock protein
MSLSQGASFHKKVEGVKAKLKWFNATKGFGFVIPEGKDVDAFLHITQLQKLGIFGLGEGAELICHIEYGDKGASVIEVLQVVSQGEGAELPLADSSEQSGIFKAKGIVKLYYPDKGYGFITPDDGMKDVFVHKSCLERCEIKHIEPGQRVRITFKAAEKGREAIEVAVEGPF